MTYKNGNYHKNLSVDILFNVLVLHKRHITSHPFSAMVSLKFFFLLFKISCMKGVPKR